MEFECLPRPSSFARIWTNASVIWASVARTARWPSSWRRTRPRRCRLLRTRRCRWNGTRSSTVRRIVLSCCRSFSELPFSVLLCWCCLWLTTYKTGVVRTPRINYTVVIWFLRASFGWDKFNDKYPFFVSYRDPFLSREKWFKRKSWERKTNSKVNQKQKCDKIDKMTMVICTLHWHLHLLIIIVTYLFTHITLDYLFTNYIL